LQKDYGIKSNCIEPFTEYTWSFIKIIPEVEHSSFS